MTTNSLELTDAQIEDALSDLQDKPIAFNRCYLRFGGPLAALLLAQACYWQRNLQDNVKREGGWWWHSAKSWENETGLTQDMLATARKKLVECGVLDYEVSGMPARGWYRVNRRELYRQMHQGIVISESKHDSGNPQNKVPVKPQTRLPENSNHNNTIPNTGIVSNSENTLDNSSDNTKKLPKKSDPSALFDNSEAPTREDLSASARRKRDDELKAIYHRIHEIAGLDKPPTFKKSDKDLLIEALSNGATADRLGIAWQKALEKSEAHFWPFHCVVEKLHLLEAKKQTQTSKKQTTEEHNREMLRAFQESGKRLGITQ